jgi:hypothetical protein
MRNPAKVDKHARQGNWPAKTTTPIETEAREDAEVRLGERERELRGGGCTPIYWVSWVYRLVGPIGMG